MKNIIFYSYYHLSNAAGSLRSKAFVEIFSDYTKIHIRTKKIEHGYRISTAKKENRRPILKKFSSSVRSLDQSLFSRYFIKEAINIFKEPRRNDRIIYCTYKPSASLYLGVLRKIIHGGYLVFEYRDLMSLFGRKPRLFILHQLDVLIEVILLLFTDLIIVVSMTQKVKLAKLTNRRIILVTNGIDKYLPIKKTLSKNVSLLYAGSLGHDRNLMNLLEWLDGTDVTVFIASKDIPYYSIDHPRVVHVGWLEEEELNALCHRVNGFILLEGQGKESNENIPAKLFYYLSFRKIIISDISPSSDINMLAGIDSIVFDIKDNVFHELNCSKYYPKLSLLNRRSVFNVLKRALSEI